MKPRLRDLSIGYRSLRARPDAIFESYEIQTLYNKLITRGKKAVSRRQLFKAMRHHRMLLALPIEDALIIPIRQLVRRVKLPLVRKGKTYLPVPTPIRRGRGAPAVLQLLATFVKKDAAFDLWKRFFKQLHELSIEEQPQALRELQEFAKRVEEAGVNARFRFKYHANSI